MVSYTVRMPKRTDKSSASTWRKKDAAYRKQQKERRDANAAKRQARRDAEEAN